MILCIALLSSAGCLPDLPGFADSECATTDETNPCAPSSTAPWGMFRHDARHTGQSDFNGSATGAFKWRFQTDGDVHATPSIGPDGTVYVGSHDRNLYALGPDGTERWKLPLGEIHASVAIRADRVLYTASEEFGNLFVYAINPDGTVRWQAAVGGEIHSSPTISEDGDVYVCAHDGLLYAFAADGREKWTLEIGECHGAVAIGDDGTIYATSEELEALFAVRPDGTVLWQFDVGASVESSAAIGRDGTVYFGAEDGLLYAVNADGSLQWAFSTGGEIASSPAISGGRAAGGAGCGADVVVVGSRDGKIYAISPGGEKLWEYATGGPIAYSSPTIGANAMVYVGSRDGSLYAVDCDGQVKWQFPTMAPIANSSAVIAPDGTLYVGSEDTFVYAIGP